MDDGRDPRAKLAAEMQKTGYAFHRVHDVSPTSFQVLGERGSGTNVIRKIVQLNVRIFRTEGLGWKHGFPTMVAIPRDMLVICAFRNAADWAISMYKRPWHAHPDLQALSFSDFLRFEWRTIVDRPSHFETLHPDIKGRGSPLQLDRHPISGLPFENLFALRRAKMSALLGMLSRQCNVALVQLEAMQADPQTLLHDLRTAYGLEPKPRPFRSPTRRMGTKFKPAIDTRAAPPQRLSSDDHAFMVSQLDLDAERLLGYTY